MADSPYVSHGRGGAANVTRDDQPYADGGVVREAQGPAVSGSTGRGGQGNIASPRVNPASGSGTPKTGAADATSTPQGATGSAAPADYVPELNLRKAPTNYHVGRGGEGNAQHYGLESVTSPDDTRSSGKQGLESQHVHHHEGAAQRFKEKILGKEGKP